MTASVSDKIRLSYIKQATKGIVPAGNWTVFRKKSDNLNGSPKTKESEEATGDGQPTGQYLVGMDVNGDIDGELAPTVSHQDFIAAAMRNTWQASITTGALALTINISTKVITRAAGSFVTDGFKVGDMVQLSNFTNSVNNTCVILTAVSALSCTYVGDVAMVNETGGAATTMVRPSYVDWGTTQTYFAICKEFLDLTSKSLSFVDETIDKMTIDFKYGDLAAIKFSLMGCSYGVPGTAINNGATIDPVASEPPLNASTDLGYVYINGAVADYPVSTLSLTVSNNTKPSEGMGALAPQDMTATGLKVEVSTTLQLADSNFSLHTAELSQAPIGIQFYVKQGTKGYAVHIPAFQFATDPISSQKGNINMLNLKGIAKKSTVINNTLRIYKLT